MRLDAESVRRVDEYAGVLRSNDRFNYCREIVDVGEGLDAEQNIIERAFFGGRCIFWCSDN